MNDFKRMLELNRLLNESDFVNEIFDDNPSRKPSRGGVRSVVNVLDNGKWKKIKLKSNELLEFVQFKLHGSGKQGLLYGKKSSPRIPEFNGRRIKDFASFNYFLSTIGSKKSGFDEGWAIYLDKDWIKFFNHRDTVEKFAKEMDKSSN